MRALYDVLDHAHSHEDRTFWLLGLMCWTCIKSVGDWMVDPREAEKCWDPARCSSRDRVTIAELEDGRHSIITEMKPPNEDPEAKHWHEAAVVTGEHDDKLSAGNAWRRMLDGDQTPVGADLTRVPIFRDAATGAEVTKTAFKKWAARSFARAGLPQFGEETHSFRIGGATTMTELAGDAAARGIGGWVSDAMLLYTHFPRQRRLDLARRMADAPAFELAAGSRPVGRAGARCR